MKRTWFSRRPTNVSFRPALQALEGRETPAVAGVALAAGADADSPPMVAAYNADGTTRFTLTAYDPSFRGGVNVATGDVNGDGIYDLITGAGFGGGPHVKVFNGVDGSLMSEWFAYDPSFRGGVYVEGGDTNGDGFADVITGAGQTGGPHVRVFSGTGGGVLGEFMAYDPSFTGGVRVGSGDFNGDGSVEIITGPGRGGGPHLRVLNLDGSAVLDRLVYAADYREGLFVDGGDVTGDGIADIIVGTQEPGGSHVRVLDGPTFLQSQDFWANNTPFGGTPLATVDLNNDGRDEIVVGSSTIDTIAVFELDEFGRFVPSDGEVDTANAAFGSGAFDNGMTLG